MKTKKAMKKITHIGMAALVAMGMLGTSCNKAESPEIETPETPKDNIVTLTTTVGFAADGTKALTSTGVKTFAIGEKMVLRYKNTKDDWVKAESNALEVGDIADGSKSATFTFTLTNPDKTKNVDYIYPAAIVNELGNMNEYALFNNQDGTLAKLASTFDYSRKIGAWDGENLPTLTLENQLAILAITLTNADGSSDITSSITGLTLSDGTKTYNVTRTAVAGPIYVAIYPTEDATITVTATDGTNLYTKSLTGKTYAASNGYSLNWRMVQIYPFTVSSGGTKVVFAPGNLQYKGSESTYKWRFAENQYDVIGTWDTSTWVDLFGWGTWTGESPKPTKTSTTYSDYTWDSADFSQENILADATQRSYDWRTLSGGSGGEWEWILGRSSSPYPGINCRTSSTVNGTANARFAKATVVSKPGVILFPDSYTHPSDVKQPASINTANAAYTVNSYNATEWGKMETAGCVFLPAAGYRDETKTVRNSGSYGCYWSSSPYSLNANQAYDVSFYSGNLYPVNSNDSRREGVSVRLVRQVE